jgi:hypothetical protein
MFGRSYSDEVAQIGIDLIKVRHPTQAIGTRMSFEHDMHKVVLTETEAVQPDEVRRFEVSIDGPKTGAVRGSCALLKDGTFRGVKPD